MSVDPRYNHRDFEAGRLVSFSDEISAARRHVFAIQMVKQGASRRLSRLPAAGATLPPPPTVPEGTILNYGDRFILLVNPEMTTVAGLKGQYALAAM